MTIFLEKQVSTSPRILFNILLQKHSMSKYLNNTPMLREPLKSLLSSCMSSGNIIDHLNFYSFLL
uniref:Putative ovule protein n=1 Tax=Solanum chacoense TaxID=4108 RepID=A0A0V0GTN4_SOLCH